MNAFLFTASVQWKLDFRSKEMLLTYYAVPLLFFLFMGGVFTSILPEASKTLLQSMTVFGVSMGAFLGAPTPLVKLYNSEIKNAYRVGGVPLWAAAVCNFLSGLLHLFAMSLVIFIAAPLLFGAIVPDNLPRYFSVLLLFITACLLVGTALGVTVKNMSKLTMISQIVFLPSIILSGIMFPARMLPPYFVAAGNILPATWGYIGLTQSGVWRKTTGILLGMIVALLVYCAWKMKRISTQET